MCIAANDFVTHLSFLCLLWQKTPLIDQTAFSQRRVQQRLDLPADPIIRIAGPGDIRIDVQKSTETSPTLISHDHTSFSRNQFRTDVVGMTADPQYQPASFHQRLSQRSKITYKPIVAHHQLVKLPA